MIYLPIFVLMLAAVAIVTYPLLWPRPELSEGSLTPVGALEDLLSQRDATYAGIRELEFEHELGNLSQLDYDVLRDDYKRKAAGLLQEIDETARAAPAPLETSPQAELEMAVRRLRDRRGEAASSLSRCPICRQPVAAGDNHCINCGAALARFCSGCGEAREPGDQFCRYCGKLQETVS